MLKQSTILPAAVCLLGAAASCAPSDPQARILEQRALWQVDLLSWAMSEDGSITISARVSGPVRSALRRLTVRIEMRDAQDRLVDAVWETLDLSEVQRGGPEDVFIRLAARPDTIEKIGIDLVPDPQPDELPHLEELRG